MQRLLDLGEKINDVKLRQNVIELIKNPELSNPNFKKYPKEDLENVKTPFSVGDAGIAIREVVNHTVTNTELCISIAEIFEKNYGIKVDKDVLVAGSLLHDIMKVYEWRIDEDGDPVPTGLKMDHVFLGVAELYARGFPEEVIQIVASTRGDSSAPKSIEALIMHHVDTLTSVTEFLANVKPKKQQMPVIVLDEETFKKMKESEGKE